MEKFCISKKSEKSFHEYVKTRPEGFKILKDAIITLAD